MGEAGAILLLASMCLGFGVAYLRLSPFSFRDEIRHHACKVLDGLNHENGDLGEYKGREYCQWLLLLAGEISKKNNEAGNLPVLVRVVVSRIDRYIAGGIAFGALATVLVLTGNHALTDGSPQEDLPLWLSAALWVLFSSALSCITILGIVGNKAVAQGCDQADRCGAEIAGFMKPRILKPVKGSSDSAENPGSQAAT